MQSPERVLVIDDSPLIRNLIEDALVEAGFTVSQASGGEEGLAVAASELPALVLCDLSMPGLSGLEVISRLKILQPKTPVIMFTESIQLQDAVAAMRLGAFGYVNKGIVDHSLIKEIRHALDHRRALERNEELERAAAQHSIEMEKLRAIEERKNALELLLEEKTAQIYQLEQARALDDRLDAIGSMVTGIAHEVNNPLSVLKAGVYFLASELPLLCAKAGAVMSEDVAATVADMESGAMRIQQIIESVKSLTRKAAPQARCNPGETITALVSDSRARLSPAAQLEADLDPAATQVGLPGEDLRLIITNLVTNSAYACGLKGPGGHVGIRVKSRDGAVIIEVKDDGCGICAEDLPQVCNPFFTTKPPGAGIGLGLSLVHQVVKNASGTMQIESVAGSGTLVRIQLPAEPNVPALRSPSARR